jgi:pimeloyl-ACP methyl ester carboxylesterase
VLTKVKFPRRGSRIVKRAGLLILLSFVWGQIGLAAIAGEEPIPYGNNPSAGHYLQVGDAKIYYEIYGSGNPLVLLHGGLFGYIDEFAGVIPELSRHYTVIAIALRGHGKSELGNQPLSNSLFAQDSAAVIRHVTGEPVNLVGFSTGALASYLLTINHPDLVRKLVAVGGPIASSGSTDAADAEAKTLLDPAELEKDLPPRFMARRNKIYPDRAAWNRLVLAMGKEEAIDPGIPKAKIQSIQCPTLIAAGDQDMYTKLEHFVEIYHLLSHGELAIVPGCGHTVFKCNPNLMLDLIERFLQQSAVPGTAR